MKTAPKPTKVTYKGNPLRRAVKMLVEMEKDFAVAGVPSSVLNPVRKELQDRMEALLINTDGIAKKPVIFFLLSGGEWFPCHGGFEVEEGVRKGWLNFRIDYENCSVDSGVAQPYEWAHCTADDLPNYHWLDPVDPPAKTEVSSE